MPRTDRPERRDPLGRGAPHVALTGAALDPAPLPLDFYRRPASEVARELLGALLVSTLGGGTAAGVIVEAEAYTGPEDEASHASARIGRTARNDPMYGPPGTAYVYRIYGIHWCLNAVTDEVDHPSAVLIRAAAPVLGLDVVRGRRTARSDRDLMRGPGNLCAALAITGALNRHRFDQPPLMIARGTTFAETDVASGPRIGVTRAAELPLRFWLRGSPWVSARSNAAAR